MDNKPFWGSIHRSTIVIFSIVIGYCLLIEYGLYSNMTTLEDSLAKEIQTKERLLEEQRRLKVEIASAEIPATHRRLSQRIVCRCAIPPKKVKTNTTTRQP